jgi:hypothetical protein
MAAGLLMRGSIMVALGMVGLVSPAAAQWLVRLELGADRFWGGSEGPAPEHLSFRPYRPTIFAGTLERRSGKVGVGLRLQYTDASLGLEGSEGVVAVKGVFTVYSVCPELSYQIASIGSNNHLYLRLGPLIEIWDIVDQAARTRAGAQGAVAFAVPLGRKITVVMSGGLALTSSPFEEDDLPDEYEIRSLWRRRFAGALQYRL